MFKNLGRFTQAHPWLICGIWLAAGLLLTVIAPSWDAKTLDDDINFLPARCPSVRGYQLLQKAFPNDVFASRAIFVYEREDRPLDSADFALLDRTVAALKELQRHDPNLKINGINYYKDHFIGKRLISADGHCSLVQVSLDTPFLALQTRATVDRAEASARTLATAAGSAAPRLFITGPAGIGRDLTGASADSLEGTTLATVILVVVILLMVYRAPLLALIPLGTIAVSVWVALKLLAMMTWIPGIYLMNISKIFAIVLLYGAGTDYCLFLISRYREELAQGQNPGNALQKTIGTVGGALAASAGTVICGLGLMGFAEFAKVRCAGPAIALGLVVALLACLTLAPAILCLLGKRVFWPAQSPRRQEVTPRRDVWDWLSYRVVARPVMVLVLVAAVLSPLVILGFRIKPDYKPMGELTSSANSIQGLAAIQRHFPAGETGPITVLLRSPTDWNTPAGRAFIDHMSRGFGYLHNVVEVRSLTQPLGAGHNLPTALPRKNASASGENKSLIGSLFRSVRRGVADVREQAERSVRGFYIAIEKPTSADQPTHYVTRLDVVPQSDPFTPDSHETLSVLQTWLRTEMPEAADALGGIEAECFGVTVNAQDLAQVIEADRMRINVLVLGGILLILIVLVRCIWLAAYLLLTVLMSYYATLGATALMGWFWDGRPLDVIDWRVPFFLFTILVAVGEDYNILMVTRALQERKRFGADEGLRRALARTGGTITSCGVIMAGTFGTLMLAGLGTLVQIGFALAFGVLLDTLVIRPFLVPAFTLLIWRHEEERVQEQPDFRLPEPQAPRRVA